CGGGAKSPLWRQIMANVCNLELEQIESEEGPGYGGAILAAVACGEYPSVEEAARRLVRVTKRTLPDKEICARYEERYSRFKKIYPAMKDLFPVLTA
nr:xylulokinase [Oscillospiraceae bacterium]